MTACNRASCSCTHLHLPISPSASPASQAMRSAQKFFSAASWMTSAAFTPPRLLGMFPAAHQALVMLAAPPENLCGW